MFELRWPPLVEERVFQELPVGSHHTLFGGNQLHAYGFLIPTQKPRRIQKVEPPIPDSETRMV